MRDHWFLMLITVSVSKRYELDGGNMRFCEEKTEGADLRGGLWEINFKFLLIDVFVIESEAMLSPKIDLFTIPYSPRTQ